MINIILVAIICKINGTTNVRKIKKQNLNYENSCEDVNIYKRVQSSSRYI